MKVQQKEGLFNKYLSLVKKVSKEYYKNPNLIGIIWIGSASFGIYDDFTDIDIFLITPKSSRDFEMQQFREIDIKVEVDKMDINWLLENTKPDSEQFWIREEAEIIYDPENILKNKFQKANYVKPEVYRKLLWSLYKEIFNSYNLEKSIKRNEIITGHMYVLKTIEILSKFVFIYHEKAVPTYKWRWYFIKKQNLIDKKLIKKLININLGDYKSNLRLLKNIETYVQKMMIKKGYPSKKVKEPWLF